MSQNLGSPVWLQPQVPPGPQLPASCSLHITNMGDPLAAHTWLFRNQFYSTQLAVCFTEAGCPPSPRGCILTRNPELLTPLSRPVSSCGRKWQVSIWQVRLSRLDSAGETCRRSSVQVFFALKTGQPEEVPWLPSGACIQTTIPGLGDQPT